jgi:hypothetical protein
MELVRQRTEPEVLRKICHSVPTNTSIGSDGVRFKEIAEGPEEAIEELGHMIREAICELVPAVQALFNIIVGIPKKNRWKSVTLPSSPRGRDSCKRCWRRHTRSGT